MNLRLMPGPEGAPLGPVTSVRLTRPGRGILLLSLKVCFAVTTLPRIGVKFSQSRDDK
jgi:hypothetical protein